MTEIKVTQISCCHLWQKQQLYCCVPQEFIAVSFSLSPFLSHFSSLRKLSRGRVMQWEAGKRGTPLLVGMARAPCSRSTPAALLILLPARDQMAWRWLWQHSCDTRILCWGCKDILNLCRTSRGCGWCFIQISESFEWEKDTPTRDFNGVFTLLKSSKFLASASWKQTFTLITRTSLVLPA